MPSSDDEIICELAPCLQLVAPVGMDLESQDTWFEAGLKALAGIPLALLKRGAVAAMQKADHPAKVVPSIMAAIGDDWEWRKRNHVASGLPAIAGPAVTASETCTPEEAAAICRQHGIGRFSSHRVPMEPQQPSVVTADADPQRTCRVPTREDYIRMGVDPAVFDSAREQQEAA